MRELSAKREAGICQIARHVLIKVKARVSKGRKTITTREDQ